jgi:hypothetical protein
MARWARGHKETKTKKKGKQGTTKMKIAKEKLKQIIKEELKSLAEGTNPKPHPAPLKEGQGIKYEVSLPEGAAIVPRGGGAPYKLEDAVVLENTTLESAKLSAIGAQLGGLPLTDVLDLGIDAYLASMDTYDATEE